MAIYSQKFKLQSVKKALSRGSDKTEQNIADEQGIGLSTLQKWIRLAKDNKLEKPTDMSNEKEKSPQDWSTPERLDAIMHCHSMNEEDVSSYCREKGIYPHHLEEWKAGFLSIKQNSEPTYRQEQKKLRQENKRLQKELNRKDRALSETAALLVLSKKCQAIWGEMGDD